MIRGGARAAGVSLVELVMGLTILTTGLLSILVSLLSAHGTVRATALEDDAWFALEDMREQMRGWDFTRLYNDFHARSLQSARLEGASGGPATIRVICHVDETKLPAEFGAIADINGSGGLETADCSTDYKLLPVELSVTWDDGRGAETRRYFFVLGPDA